MAMILFWLGAIALAIYAYLKLWVFTYWKRRGVPHDEPLVPLGNMLPSLLGKASLGDTVKASYERHKHRPYHGIYMFHQPILVINEPDLIKHVLIKDFNKFRDRGLYHNEQVDPLSANLFFLPGEKWRQLRSKLSPTFTSGKLKQMYPLLREIGDELAKVARLEVERSPVVELKDLIGRYTTDSISSIAFGFNCNSLDDPGSDFKRYGRKAIENSPVRQGLGMFAPVVLDALRVPLFYPDVIDFFTSTFRDMMERRRRDPGRRDFLSLLIQLIDTGVIEADEKVIGNGNCNDSAKQPQQQQEKSDDGRISVAQAQAQAFVFFLAGFETTSSTVTYCLYELALRPELQDRLYEELLAASKLPGGFTYERIINELEYLHMVFNETLRKHPSVPFLNRVCIEDTRLPGTDLKLQKGQATMICVSGLHRDPDIFPDPDRFDPERFTKEAVAARNPYVYLPFGDGPRVCIGTRFGVLQSKIALISLLMNFRITTCDKTPIPIGYSKCAVVQAPEGGVYVKFEKRNK
ncbi:probable cytochrome P450 6a14 [Trichogramma pretiosum]|uniref:probable cytochrome P450 6a14 n=1 Tax=Trichogramma pretiosum TaxID=7493 RepID=UPI0006C9B4EA|nr:probable cytochrome P450 6a14 [Trichogramma pretiosum]